MKPILPALTITASLLLGACATTGTSPEPAGSQDWIDIPLSDNTYFDTLTPFLQGSYEIFVPAYSALEHKIGMREGDIVVYSWEAEMPEPALLTAEFHGHTERQGSEPGLVMFYKIHNDAQERGTLIAPFDGVHGWYLNNESDQDVVVILNVSGFYEEIEQEY